MRLPLSAALLCALSFASTVSPAKAPTDAATVAYATQLMQDSYDADGPGAVALIARGDKVIFREARGIASVELNVPLNPDHVLRIGSVTKQFAAAALLKLVDDGKVKLDDTLDKYLPDFPNAKAITIAQLLNHTSGVKSYTDIDGVMNGPIRRDVSTAELVDTFKDEPVDFAPGADWAYNNSGYVLVGAVIEAASGMSWDAYLTSALLAPAGLTHTQYGADDRIIQGMAQGYGKAGDALAPASFLSMTQPHAAGALVSTVDDLHRWQEPLVKGLRVAAYFNGPIRRFERKKHAVFLDVPGMLGVARSFDKQPSDLVPGTAHDGAVFKGRQTHQRLKSNLATGVSKALLRRLRMHIAPRQQAVVLVSKFN